MPGDSHLLFWWAVVLALVLVVSGLARADRRWLNRARAAFTRARATRLRSGIELLRRLRGRAALPVRRRLTLAPIRRRRARMATECAYPIVLAHGWMGLDSLVLPG